MERARADGRRSEGPVEEPRDGRIQGTVLHHGVHQDLWQRRNDQAAGKVWFEADVEQDLVHGVLHESGLFLRSLSLLGMEHQTVRVPHGDVRIGLSGEWIVIHRDGGLRRAPRSRPGWLQQAVFRDGPRPVRLCEGERSEAYAALSSGFESFLDSKA